MNQDLIEKGREIAYNMLWGLLVGYPLTLAFVIKLIPIITGLFLSISFFLMYVLLRYVKMNHIDFKRLFKWY